VTRFSTGALRSVSDDRAPGRNGLTTTVESREPPTQKACGSGKLRSSEEIDERRLVANGAPGDLGREALRRGGDLQRFDDEARGRCARHPRRRE
jgi:hypothetical protein